MKGPVRRKENWETKCNLDRVKQTLEGKRAKMAEHYEAAIVAMCAKETKVRETLLV